MIMSVQINWKICDNDKACGGIAECPTGALYWNEMQETIGIKNEFCISCRKCVDTGCPVGAIIVTDSEEEFNQVKANIERDPRDKAQLFVDRFGAAPISDDILIDKESICDIAKTGVVFVEHFTESSIQCLIHSIKVDDVRYKTKCNFAYYKCEDSEEEATEYPILDIFVNGNLKGSVSGYFLDSEFNEFINKIKKIIDQ